jgi:hypothetical protein
MHLLLRLEKRILQLVKDTPHLPPEAEKWLGRNIWIIVMVLSIISAVALFYLFIDWVAFVRAFNDPRGVLYSYGGISEWRIARDVTGFILSALVLVLTFSAVKPLKSESKKGWVLLFVAWLLAFTAFVLNALLSFNAFTFILVLLTGATFALISGYVLFEVHAYFDKKPLDRAAVASKKV